MIDLEAKGVVGEGPEEEQHCLAKQLLQGGHYSFQCRVNPLRCISTGQIVSSEFRDSTEWVPSDLQPPLVVWLRRALGPIP